MQNNLAKNVRLVTVIIKYYLHWFKFAFVQYFITLLEHENLQTENFILHFKYYKQPVFSVLVAYYFYFYQYQNRFQIENMEKISTGFTKFSFPKKKKTAD